MAVSSPKDASLCSARASRAPFFPPRVAEPGTGDRDLEWIDALGLGAVYSVMVIGQKPPSPMRSRRHAANGLFATVEAANPIVDVALGHGSGGTLSGQATILLGSAATLSSRPAG